MNKNCTGFLIIILILSLFSIKAYPQSDANTTGRIDSLMVLLHKRGQFNGSILISINKKPVYKKAYGKADLGTGADFTVSTPCYLASLSKQFTAMGIMILQERGLLAYNDPLSKYFPEFPPYGNSVTIQTLLNHTSGIVNYEGLGIDQPGLTNEGVLNGIKKTALRFHPGDKYEYSNSGYVLLAMIIEKVSGQSFSEFMQQYIFQPLNMRNTFVYDKATAPTRAKAYNKFSDLSDYNGLTTGDGGIFSTVEDLFKWDQALDANKLVSASTLNKEFEPTILNDGKSSPYGLGWMLKEEDGERIAYHTGGSGGFRTYIERQLDHHNTIIILTNMENSPRIEIRNVIMNILKNKPYQLPPISIASEMYTIRNKNGIDSAISFYHFSKQAHSDMYDFREQELNLLGYKLWSINKIGEAIAVFKLNVAAYPNSSNTYESLGEALLKKNDKPSAIENFNRSLAIDPQNTDAIRMLRSINKP